MNASTIDSSGGVRAGGERTKEHLSCMGEFVEGFPPFFSGEDEVEGVYMGVGKEG